ncbi:MAG: acyl-CoA dehydrogenase family protein, partial [Actinomycetota bacterium]
MDAKGLPANPSGRRITPPFSQEHEELRDSLRRFVATELAPHADDWERDRWFPDDCFTRMGELGFFGLSMPIALGGQGGDMLHEAVLAEELAACGSAGVAAGLGAHVAIATPPVWKFGTDDQHERYVRPSIAGTKIAALGITEPHAGSDVASLRTVASKVDGGWSVTGEKCYITNGVRADFVVMAVKTSADGGHGGISFLIVDTDQPGYRTSKLEKMGWHASDTALIALDEVFVPDENLLGGVNEGFKLIMANFQWERLMMALGSVAAMQLIFDKTLLYAAERQAFGRKIGNFQAIRHKFA